MSDFVVLTRMALHAGEDPAAHPWQVRVMKAGAMAQLMLNVGMVTTNDRDMQVIVAGIDFIHNPGNGRIEEALG